jgi:ribonucrease Y
MSLIFALIGLAIGAGGVYAFFNAQGATRLKKIQAESEKEIAKIQKHQKELEHKTLEIETKIREKILDAKNKAIEIMDEAKKEETERRKGLEKLEQRLISKEDSIDHKIAESEKVKDEFTKKIEKLKVDEEKVEALYQEQEKVLTKLTGLSKEDAKNLLLSNVERDYKDDIVKHYHKIENDAKEESGKKAKDVIVQAIQKMASSVTSESTQTLVELASDDIKGRVIGREGRNINAFEHLTGVDVIVDDTPGAIVISGFDLVRRYVAKRSLEKLIEDGRIHPARIETIVEETKNEVGQMMVESGEKAAQEMGIAGLHPDLVKIIGRLRFRTSYGQNVLKHSMEVGYIAAAMAAELGLNIQVAKAAGFLHDIGKAVDHEVEGSHALISRDILKKYGISKDVIHAVESHHEEVPFASAEAMIVQAADAISAARPGARRESLATYLKRLQELEDLALSFKGVEKAYAIQAGREVRVMVKPQEIDDLGAIQLAHEMARKIEKELAYPGTVKVNVLRETRAVEIAR